MAHAARRGRAGRRTARRVGRDPRHSGRSSRALPPEVVGQVIRWVANGSAAREASRQIETASCRIHDLVRAVKGFTFMDREGVPEAVDVARGLADTLAMLEGKARAKSATVHCETAADLPRVDGFGSEINQVWEKLVDNALDAVGTQGNVTITANSPWRFRPRPDRGRRPGHSGGDSRADLRSVLHDKACRAGDRAGSRHGAPDCSEPRRRHRLQHAARTHGVSGAAAGRSVM